MPYRIVPECRQLQRIDENSRLAPYQKAAVCVPTRTPYYDYNRAESEARFQTGKWQFPWSVVEAAEDPNEWENFLALYRQGRFRVEN